MAGTNEQEVKFSLGLKGLTAWVLHWADTKYAAPMLGVLSFMESSFFPIPPDVLLIPMGASRPDRAIRFASITTVASILGGMLGYGIGYFLFDTIGIKIIEFYGYMDKYILFREWFEKYNFAIIMVAGLTPLPYKVFTITAGVAGVNFPVFVLGSVVSRSTRFMAEGVVCHYGDFFSEKIFKMPVRDALVKYINWFAILMAVLGVAGFLVVKWVMPGYQVDLTKTEMIGDREVAMNLASSELEDKSGFDYTLSIGADGSTVSAEIPGGPFLHPSRGKADIKHAALESGDIIVAAAIYHDRAKPQKGTDCRVTFFRSENGKLIALGSMTFPGYELLETGAWIEGSLDYVSPGKTGDGRDMIEVRVSTISHMGIKEGEEVEDKKLYHYAVSEDKLVPLDW